MAGVIDMGIPKQLQAEVDVLESLHEDLELEVAPPQCSETEELSQKIEVLRRRYDTRSVEVIIHDLAWWQLRAELLTKRVSGLSHDECSWRELYHSMKEKAGYWKERALSLEKYFATLTSHEDEYDDI